MPEVQLEESWKTLLEDEFEQPYFQQLTQAVRKEYQEKRVYPPGKWIFRALDSCPVAKVKVVILGQDPYHGAGQANGFAFSVPQGVAVPPSLQNIYREIEQDTGFPAPETGDLTPWVEQGVLLLNSTLTVRAGQAGSHQNLGWERFTDAIVERLSQEKDFLVFLLWGRYAQRKGSNIDRQKHCVLTAVHPSPLAANRGGWFGCRHFSQANTYLEEHGLTPIVW